MKELTCVTLSKYSDGAEIYFEFGGNNGLILNLHRGQSYLSVISALNALEGDIRELTRATETTPRE